MDEHTQQILVTTQIKEDSGILSIDPKKRLLRDLINKISCRTRLRDLLEDYGIADVEQIKEITDYRKSDDRGGIIVTAKEHRFSTDTKIIIDLRLQEPSISQVNDALYGIGKDCEIKIIMHTDGDDIGADYYEYPSADHSIVVSLVGELQSCNIPILLLRIGEASSDIEYIPEGQDWERVNRLKALALPTQEDFWLYTFWSVYYGCMKSLNLYCGDDIYRSAFTNNSSLIGKVLYWEHYKLYVKWENDSINIEIKQTDNSRPFLQNALEIESVELNRQYGMSNVRFENVVGRLPRLYIKRPCKPINWLFTAHPQEIRKFASTLVNEISDLEIKLSQK